MAKLGLSKFHHSDVMKRKSEGQQEDPQSASLLAVAGGGGRRRRLQGTKDGQPGACETRSTIEESNKKLQAGDGAPERSESVSGVGAWGGNVANTLNECHNLLLFATSSLEFYSRMVRRHVCNLLRIKRV